MMENWFIITEVRAEPRDESVDISLIYLLFMEILQTYRHCSSLPGSYESIAGNK